MSFPIDVLVLPLGVTREFVCKSPPTTGYTIAWGVNGTSATSIEFQDYIVLGEEVHLQNGGIQRNLIFIADIKANNTHIRCILTSINDGESGFLVDISLSLQGKVVTELIKKLSNDRVSPLRSSTFSYCDI